jgi:hypothetical protein
MAYRLKIADLDDDDDDDDDEEEEEEEEEEEFSQDEVLFLR